MPVTDFSTQIALTELKALINTNQIETKLIITANQTEIAALKASLSVLQSDRDSAIRYAVIILFGAVVTMAGYIFNLISGHAK